MASQVLALLLPFRQNMARQRGKSTSPGVSELAAKLVTHLASQLAFVRKHETTRAVEWLGGVREKGSGFRKRKAHGEGVTVFFNILVRRLALKIETV